jgi:hypothetical protein
MPDTRRHRGPHPHDAQLFGADVHPRLREAVAHLSWLLTRGYAPASSLKLVGDRFSLVERQRRAVLRSVCSDQARADRTARRVEPSQLAGRPLNIDGFNLLTTVEAALAGGVLLRGRDGCMRDMASMHGSYRRVEETSPALCLIGTFLESCHVGPCHWWLDEPVSNSGRLRTLMTALADQRGWPWTVDLVPNPDAVLGESKHVVVSADSAVLDACGRWCNLADAILRENAPTSPVIDLRDEAASDNQWDLGFEI